MKKAFLCILSACVIFSISGCGAAKKNELQKQIEKIIESKQAQTGAAVIGYAPDRELIVIGGDFNYPMQSVYKFHLALAVMKMADEGILNLEDSFFVFKESFDRTMHSPMMERHEEEIFTVTLSELLNYSLAESDNVACDMLFDIAGGTGKVNEYIQSLGIEGINIAATEYEMHQDFDKQYSNRSTPQAAAELLEKFYSGHLVSSKSRDFILEAMRSSATGANRLKAGLPAGASAANKTGTGPEKDGIISACNDIAIINFAGGSDYFIIAVFITDSKETLEASEAIIADTAKAACGYFNKK